MKRADKKFDVDLTYETEDEHDKRSSKKSKTCNEYNHYNQPIEIPSKPSEMTKVGLPWLWARRNTTSAGGDYNENETEQVLLALETRYKDEWMGSGELFKIAKEAVVEFYPGATKSGKWLLMNISEENIDALFTKISDGVREGKLGPVAKVGIMTDNGISKTFMICIYTKDFTDRDDVERVLRALGRDGLNLIPPDGKKIGYKADIVTLWGAKYHGTSTLNRSTFYQGEYDDSGEGGVKMITPEHMKRNKGKGSKINF